MIAGIPGALVATPLVGAAKAIYLEAGAWPSPSRTRGRGLVGRIRRLFRRRKD